MQAFAPPWDFFRTQIVEMFVRTISLLTVHSNHPEKTPGAMVCYGPHALIIEWF